MSVLSFGPGIIAVSRPGTTKTNDATSDQDFAAIGTLPANLLVEKKIVLVSLNTSLVTGVSSATLTGYLKLGGVKVLTALTSNVADSLNPRTGLLLFQLMGTAAPGASVAVEAGAAGPMYPVGGLGSSAINNLAQPVAGIATDGTLDVVYGVAWNATGSTETITLLSGHIWVLN